MKKWLVLIALSLPIFGMNNGKTKKPISSSCNYNFDEIQGSYRPEIGFSAFRINSAFENNKPLENIASGINEVLTPIVRPKKTEKPHYKEQIRSKTEPIRSKPMDKQSESIPSKKRIMSYEFKPTQKISSEEFFSKKRIMSYGFERTQKISFEEIFKILKNNDPIFMKGIFMQSFHRKEKEDKNFEWNTEKNDFPIVITEYTR